MTTEANPPAAAPASATPSLRRFDTPGLLAIDPRAFGQAFPVLGMPAAPFALVADSKIAVVTIDGPLCYAGWWWGSYEQVRDRVAQALASSAECVVLRINSPGGDVAGAFDCARGLRAACRAAGKRLVAFTEASACSSAYAIASAADEIVASDTAVVGSIGVIATAVETTRADAAMGLTFAIVASGNRKADGNPHVPLSDDAIAAMRAAVTAMAAVFFELVAKHRGDRLTAEAAEALQAGTFVGREALAKGLVDRVASWDEFLASYDSSEKSGVRLAESKTASAVDEDPMPKDDEKEKDEARSALAKAAEDKDEKKAARAKRALKAYDESDDEKAADDKPEPKDEKKDDEKASASAASAASVAAAADLARTVQAQAAQIAALTARNEAADRAAIFASRPDLAEATVKALAKIPTDQLQAIVDSIPKAFTPHAPQLAGTPPQGGTPGATGVVLPPNPELDRLMGLDKSSPKSAFDAKTGVFTLGSK